MDSISFTYVPVEGFTGFSNNLGTGAWGLVDIAAFEGPNQSAAKPLCDAPAAVIHKLQLAWAIGHLAAAKDGAGSAGDRDRDWDKTQKRLRGRLDAGANDKDPAKSAAAARLRKSLTIGSGGEGQTKLKYQQEVDFGREQVRTATGQAAADVALLGLEDVIADIGETTDDLADAIGYGQSADRPHKRLRAAVAACASTFSAVAEQLAWVARYGQTGADQARATELRGPLQALSARYPAPPPAATPAAPTGTPPSTSAGPDNTQKPS